MNKVCSIISRKEEDTAAFAAQMARLAKKGDIIALFGTLGMGKSVFSRAFVQSLMGNVDVPSPTFTLLQTYDAPEFEIYHYDLYRLKDPDEIFELGMEEAMYEGVCLIEWPEKMGGYLPRRAVRISITAQDDARLFEVFTDDKERFTRFSVLKEA